jgi:ankyrin repeat protein
MFIATLKGHADIVNALLVAGANVDAVGKDGLTLLHYTRTSTNSWMGILASACDQTVFLVD